MRINVIVATTLLTSVAWQPQITVVTRSTGVTAEAYKSKVKFIIGVLILQCCIFTSLTVCYIKQVTGRLFDGFGNAVYERVNKDLYVQADIHSMELQSLDLCCRKWQRSAHFHSHLDISMAHMAAQKQGHQHNHPCTWNRK